MKKRYLVQRLDTEEFFVHPCDNPRELRQWIKDPLKAHRWVDYDSCAAAVQTAEMVWGIPSMVHSVCVPLYDQKN